MSLRGKFRPGFAPNSTLSKDIRDLILGYAMICGENNIGGDVSCHLFSYAGRCAGGSIKGLVRFDIKLIALSQDTISCLCINNTVLVRIIYKSISRITSLQSTSPNPSSRPSP